MQILIRHCPGNHDATGSQPMTGRTRVMPRRLAVALLAGIAQLAGAGAGAEAGADSGVDANSLDASRIGWSNLSYRATKFFFSVDADISIAAASADQITGQLMEPGEGKAVTPSGNTQTLVFRTAAFGRNTTATLIIDSDTGAALQRTSHDSGKRYRHRIYRFTDSGAYHRTRWPVGKAEEQLPADQWAQWSEAGEGMNPYPDAAVDSILTDPGGLLYIVGAAPLDEPGDVFVINAYVRRHVHRVEIEVAGMEQIKVRYSERGTTDVERHGKRDALKLLIRGKVLGDDDGKNEFELLGLRGDIVMHIDPRTRAPLQIEGRVKIAGHTIMRIRELVLNDSQTVTGE